jgi:hypothetical protein
VNTRSCGLVPACPARQGHGTDMATAAFTLVAEDYPDDSDGAPHTEIFGIFRAPSQDPEDHVQVSGLDVPARSPIADLARRVAANPDLTRKAGDQLRAAIVACSCTALGPCPAFDDLRLLQAIEYATGVAL